MLKRYEPRFLITGTYDWEDLLAQNTSTAITKDTVDAVVSRANGALVTFKGLYEGTDDNFTWRLLARKTGGPDITIAYGTGTLGSHDITGASNPAAGTHLMADSITVTDANWFSDVLVTTDTVSGVTYGSYLSFDMFGFSSLICLCSPATEAGCTSVGAIVTWL